MGVRKKSSTLEVHGQDGSHVADLSLVKSHAMYGIKRRTACQINVETTRKPDALWCVLTSAASVPLKWQRYWAAQARLANRLA